jgi:hypothetical protein
MGVLYAKVDGTWVPVVSAVSGEFLPLAGGALTGPLILPGAPEADLATSGPLTIGATTGPNVTFDSNEIQGRNNGAANPLNLNPQGGPVNVGSTTVAASLILNGPQPAATPLIVQSAGVEFGRIFPFSTNSLAIQATRAATDLGLQATGSILFASGGTDSGRITPAGNLQMGADPLGGTSSPGVLVAGASGRIVSAVLPPSGVLFPNIHLGRGGSPTANANSVFIQFNRGAAATDPFGVQIGTIATNAGGSGVVYNTTSDHRLKDDLGPITDALARVAALAPKRVRWHETGHECDGFIAHEVAEVMPEVVTGDKDAVLPADDPHNPGGIDPQQLDLPGMVPVLVAAVQQLSAEVATLRAEVNALKGAA